MTAQDAFDALLRDHIAPRLRELGFKGSGQRYELRDPQIHAMLGFQKAQISNADAVKFTVNVGSVARQAWKQFREERPHLPEHPSPNIFYGGPVWQQRIGPLTPEGDDLWWWLEADSRPQDAAAAVLDAIERYAIPALHERRHGRI